MAPKKERGDDAARIIKECENLLKAAKEDDTKKCQIALTKGANLDWQNDKGNSAVHVAAAFGALEVLFLLHTRGAAFALKNEKKMTPLDVAEKIGEEEAAELIRAILDDKPDAEIEALVRAAGTVEEEVAAAEPKAAAPETPVEVPAETTPVEVPAVSAIASDGGVVAQVEIEPAAVEAVAERDHPDALLWSDVHSHGRGANGAMAKDGSLTVVACPHVDCWVVGVGADTRRVGEACAFRVLASRHQSADAMLLGLVDDTAAAAGARACSQARAVLYNPRAGEVWAMDKGRVVERISLEAPVACLFARADGAEVTMRLLGGGRLGVVVNGGAEMLVPIAMPLPDEVRACARLGKAGDAVALRRPRTALAAVGSAAAAAAETKTGRGERASNDSVITEAAMPA